MRPVGLFTTSNLTLHMLRSTCVPPPCWASAPESGVSSAAVRQGWGACCLAVWGGGDNPGSSCSEHFQAGPALRPRRLVAMCTKDTGEDDRSASPRDGHQHLADGPRLLGPHSLVEVLKPTRITQFMSVGPLLSLYPKESEAGA